MKDYHKKLFADSLAFIIKYRLIEKADKPVMKIETKREKRSTNIDREASTGKHDNQPFFIHKLVHLTAEYKYPKSRKQVTGSSLNKDGKHQELTPVKAHIRQLMDGTGEIRTIYVRAYERNQWKNDGVIIKTVKE